MMGMGGGTGGALGGMNPLNTGRFNMPGTGGNMGIDLHRIPIVGNMFQNPYDQFKQQQMQNAAAAYSMYRPEAQQAWMNAQNMQASQLQPMNNALAAMYGTGATQGFEAQNPFGVTAFQRGAAVGTNPSMPTPGGPPNAQDLAPGGGGVHGAGDTAMDLLGQVPGFFSGAAGQLNNSVTGGAQGAMNGFSQIGQGFGGFGSGVYDLVSGNGTWGGLGQGRWF